ncbi:MAG: BlaI/MecI/CopY family transcriptional regulator [Marmoricola sp.]
MERRARGSLEQEVIAVLAATGQPRTVAEVLADLSGTPAYTTVMTTLTRLCDKGALQRERRGRGFLYSLAAAPQSVDAARTARKMTRLLEDHRGGRRSDVLARFVAELEPGDEELLLTLLGEADSAPTDPPVR